VDPIYSGLAAELSATLCYGKVRKFFTNLCPCGVSHHASVILSAEPAADALVEHNRLAQSPPATASAAKPARLPLPARRVRHRSARTALPVRPGRSSALTPDQGRSHPARAVALALQAANGIVPWERGHPGRVCRRRRFRSRRRRGGSRRTGRVPAAPRARPAAAGRLAAALTARPRRARPVPLRTHEGGGHPARGHPGRVLWRRPGRRSQLPAAGASWRNPERAHARASTTGKTVGR